MLSRYIRRDDGNQGMKISQIPCRYHEGSICLIYCNEIACYKLLCQECIEEHLQYHKKNGLGVNSIRSFKKIREFCVQKLGRLMELLSGQISGLKYPKNHQQILDEGNMKIDAIKKLMLQIIEIQLSKFYQQLKNKVNQSFSTIKNLQQIHQNLTKIIQQLSQYQKIIIQSTKQIPQTIQTVISTNQQLYIDTFSREIQVYKQKLSFLDFDISINQNKFRSSVNQCLKISGCNNNDMQNGQYYKKGSLSSVSKSASIHTPNNRSRLKSDYQFQQNPINLQLQSQHKYLHFFETGSSILHLIDINNPDRIKQQKIVLNAYIVPSFHSSILTTNGLIFISGGIIQVGETQKKSQKLCRFSLKSKNNQNFKKDFAKVKQRSSHSLCQLGEFIYILGGYGQEKKDQIQAQKSVERVNIMTGQVQFQAKSKYGGANISLSIGNSILKASEQGVQIYNISTKKWLTIQIPKNYQFIRGCGWTKISKQSILIYGGYDDNENGIDICRIWYILQNEIQIKNINNNLIYKQGFLNNPGIIVKGELYVLQNICMEQNQNNTDSTQCLIQNQRKLLAFDGGKWKEIYFDL